MAYGIHDPVEDDSGPPRCRALKLIYYKQALARAMPQGQMEWDDSVEHSWNQGGNPARSSAVNKMIKKVKKFEIHNYNR